jgi:hypothetical protein
MNDNAKSLLKLAFVIVFICFLIWISKDKVFIYKDDGTYERIK